MATITIAISLQPPNKLVVNNPTATASRGDPSTGKPADRVEWTCTHDWAVDFNPVINVGNGQANPHSPFGPNGFRGGPNQVDGGNVRPNADQHHHRYTVAVWDGSIVRTLDPDLDII
jgi:hypothetical protein